MSGVIYAGTKAYTILTETTVREHCGRCGGQGVLESFRHVDAGICFKCNGAKWLGPIEDRAFIEAKAERLRIAAEKREAKRMAEWKVKEAARLEREAKWQAEKDAAREARAAQSKHLPAAEGERTEVTGTVVLARELDGGQFGPKMLIILDCGDGITVKTFSTSAWVWNVDRGDVVTVKATVKEHGEYKGEKSTTVARAQLVGDIIAATKEGGDN